MQTLRNFPNARDKRLKEGDLDLALNEVAEQRQCSYGDIVLEAMKTWLDNRAKPHLDIWKKAPAKHTKAFWEGVKSHFEVQPFHLWGMRMNDALREAAREYLEELKSDVR